jgi:epoxyqueuosine reductase
MVVMLSGVEAFLLQTMDALFHHSSMIRAEALRLGFDKCGISRAEYLSEDAERLESWLRNQYHGQMAYMENHADKRVDPTKLVAGAQSVISVLLNYYPAEDQQDPSAPLISKYAYGEDYHNVIRHKLQELLRYIQGNIAPAAGRAFVDSAPVLDRAWAARAGLGWIGKNTNLITPESGSFFFIGALIVDITLHYDQPIQDFCGDCNRCIRACPTTAIIAPRLIDARKCISYLTIENKGEIDTNLRAHFHNRVFGCDICQDVCPWNRKAKPHNVKEFQPPDGLLEMSRQEWHDLDEPRFNELFRRSAVKRATFEGLRRNLKFIE